MLQFRHSLKAAQRLSFDFFLQLQINNKHRFFRFPTGQIYLKKKNRKITKTKNKQTIVVQRHMHLQYHYRLQTILDQTGNLRGILCRILLCDNELIEQFLRHSIKQII